MDPAWRVLIYSSVAAATAAFGALPLASGRTQPLRLFGWANALASGLMLGVAYSLMAVSLDRGLAQTGLGALAGIACITLARAVAGTAGVIRLGAIHAVPEGIAIGVAMAAGLPFGALMTTALAVHNIPEATVAIATMTRRGTSLTLATLLAVAANVNQVVFALAAFLLVSAVPVLLPWTLGFAFGALLYLVMVELLPDSYRDAGRTSIALVTIVAMGIVVLLHDGGR